MHMPKIKLFLMGQHHSDPASLQVTHRMIQKAIRSKIPLCVGREMAKDTSLAKLSKSLSDDLPFACEVNKLKKLIIKNNGKLSRSTLNQFLKQCTSPIVLESFDRIYGEIMTDTLPYNIVGEYHKDVELAKMLITLSSHKIPFLGLEFNSKQRQKFENLLDRVRSQEQFDALVSDWEPKRMSEMSNNILRQVLSLATTGGIIFEIDLGKVHAHRLAAYLAILFSKSNLPKDLEIEIIPVRVSSTHAQEEHDIVMQEEEQQFSTLLSKSIDHDSVDVLNLYNEIPCFDLMFVKDASRGVYTCEEFEKMLEDKKGKFYTFTSQASQKPELKERDERKKLEVDLKNEGDDIDDLNAAITEVYAGAGPGPSVGAGAGAGATVDRAVPVPAVPVVPGTIIFSQQTALVDRVVPGTLIFSQQTAVEGERVTGARAGVGAGVETEMAPTMGATDATNLLANPEAATSQMNPKNKKKKKKQKKAAV